MRTTPPSLEDIDRMARKAWEALPSDFRKLAGDILIRVEELAEDKVLADLGIEDPLELTGLYVGPDVNERSVMNPSPEPTMVFLYRQAILFEWIDHGDVDLAELVAHVLVHEIGHHFGLSDEHMDELLEQAP